MSSFLPFNHMIQKPLQHHFCIYNLTFRSVQKFLQGYLWYCRHCIVLVMFAWNCNSRITSQTSCKISLPVLFSQWYSDFKRNWEVLESKRQWRRADRNASCFRWSTKIAHVSLFPFTQYHFFCKVTYSFRLSHSISVGYQISLFLSEGWSFCSEASFIVTSLCW